MIIAKKKESQALRLETGRLLLRPFARRDAAAASYNSRQPSVAHFMSDMVLPTKRHARRWIRWIEQKMDVKIPFVLLAVELKESGRCIGLIGIGPKRELDNEIEILFEIADEHQSRGYITEAGKALIAWTFDNTGIPQLIAIVKHDNLASQRVIAKLGFVYAGERRIDYDGQMTDFHYYRLERGNQ